jgi:hypothetical protein
MENGHAAVAAAPADHDDRAGRLSNLEIACGAVSAWPEMALCRG